MRSFDVLSIGPAFVDLFINVQDSFLEEIGLAKSRCRYVTYAEQQDIISKHKPAQISSGGCAANTAATMASLGLDVAWLYKLADDDLGKAVIAEMAELGVYYNTPFTASGEGSGSCVILSTPDGERTMCTYFGAQKDFSATDIDEEVIKNSKILYVAGCGMDDKTNEALEKAFVTAKKHGTLTCLNTFDVRAIEKTRDFFEYLFKKDLVDMFFGNQDEMSAFFGTNDENILLGKLKSKLFTSVVTMGSNGAAIVKDGSIIKVPCRKIEKIVDATGAGDAFVAGYLYALCNGKAPYDCAVKGNEIAGLAVMEVGAKPKITAVNKEL